MKTSGLTATCLSLLLLGAYSCSDKCSVGDKTCDNSVCFTTIEQQQSFVLKGSAKDFSTDEDIIYTCEANLMMPKAVNGFNLDSLHNAIFKTAFDTTATASHDKLIGGAFLASAKSFGYTPVDTVVPENTYDGCLVVEGDVVAMTPTILSYAVTVSKYEPFAAHGMYGTYYINYDLKNGKVFNLQDVVTAEGIAQLPSTLREIALSMRNFTGPTDLTALPADGNFYIDTRNNLVFVYQPYEIASYSQGLIEIPVPAYQISDLLTPFGKSLLNL